MTPTEFCKVVENRLGWVPPTFGQGWKTYNAEAAKVKRKVASNPSLYTWDNLLLAVELLVREREPRTPLGVFAHVERALERKRETDSDVETRIWRAIAVEQAKGDPDGWVGRLSRATGAYRREAVDEWEALQ